MTLSNLNLSLIWSTIISNNKLRLGSIYIVTWDLVYFDLIQSILVLNILNKWKLTIMEYNEADISLIPVIEQENQFDRTNAITVNALIWSFSDYWFTKPGLTIAICKLHSIEWLIIWRCTVIQSPVLLLLCQIVTKWPIQRTAANVSGEHLQDSSLRLYCSEFGRIWR